MEQRLKPRKVSDQFEDAQDPHDANQPDDLAGLPDDLDVLQLVQEQRQVEGDDGKQVDLVNGISSSELIFHNSVVIVCRDTLE